MLCVPFLHTFTKNGCMIKDNHSEWLSSVRCTLYIPGVAHAEYQSIIIILGKKYIFCQNSGDSRHWIKIPQQTSKLDQKISNHWMDRPCDGRGIPSVNHSLQKVRIFINTSRVTLKRWILAVKTWYFTHSQPVVAQKNAGNRATLVYCATYVFDSHHFVCTSSRG